MDAPDDGWPLPDLFSPQQWRVIGRRLRLSRRQLEIARLMCRGLQRKQIAAALNLTEATVRTHMEALFRRLEIRDRIGVPVRAIIAHRGNRSKRNARA